MNHHLWTIRHGPINELEMLEMGKEPFQRQFRFQTGERCTEAKVYAGSERDMPIAPSRGIRTAAAPT